MITDAALKFGRSHLVGEVGTFNRGLKRFLWRRRVLPAHFGKLRFNLLLIPCLLLGTEHDASGLLQRGEVFAERLVNDHAVGGNLVIGAAPPREEMELEI